MKRGKCQEPGANPDLWFTTIPPLVKEAVSLCEACPIRQACAKATLADIDAGRRIHGVWAGFNFGDVGYAPLRDRLRERVKIIAEMTPDERAALLRMKPKESVLTPPRDDGLSTLRELAHRLGVNEKKVRQCVSEGRISVAKREGTGRKFLFDLDRACAEFVATA